MLLLMASTVSFHSDSFMARIDVSFPFVVAWKRARKVDNESLEVAYILAPFFAATIRLAYMQCSVRDTPLSSFLGEFSGLRNYFACYFVYSSPVEKL